MCFCCNIFDDKCHRNKCHEHNDCGCFEKKKEYKKCCVWECKLECKPLYVFGDDQCQKRCGESRPDYCHQHECKPCGRGGSASSQRRCHIHQPAYCPLICPKNFGNYSPDFWERGFDYRQNGTREY